MDIQIIIDAVREIPTLVEKIEELENANKELRNALNDVKKVNELINVDRGAEILGLTKNTTRKIFREIGASRIGKRLIVSSDQLIKWHQQNRSPSKLEIDRTAEKYCWEKPLRRTPPRTTSKEREVV